MMFLSPDCQSKRLFFYFNTKSPETPIWDETGWLSWAMETLLASIQSML